MATESNAIYNIMIVDDSAVIRGAIARAIESDPSLRIVSSVSDGDMAVKSLQRDPVDVIVLDIEMPIMDGLTALPLLKAVDPAVQIIMASTLTQKNAEISLRAMSLGATDYIPKPMAARDVSGADDFKRELIEKIKALGALARRTGVRQGKAAHKELPATQPSARTVVSPTASAAVRVATPLPAAKKDVVLRKEAIQRPDIIAIGCSTGGPQALFNVIAAMGADLSQPIVITQHMPPSFTTILAEHITRQCSVVCVEAKNGDVLKAGQYYIAPGDFHMVFESKGAGTTVKLTKDAPENFCRPAVDPMLRSLIPIYGKRILSVILTGMGQDGTKGCAAIVQAGASVIAQDEATSVVWGMPGSAAMAGLCSAVLPLNHIGAFVRQNAMRPRG